MSSADLIARARVRGHAPGDVTRALWEQRTLVKTWLVRGTLHLVPADDLPLFVGALDPRGKYAGSWLRYFGGTAGDVERLIDAVADALDGQALTREELAAAVGARLGKSAGERLHSGWGEFLKPASRRGVLCFGPSRGRNVTFVRPDQWLGRWRKVSAEEAWPELLRRFLRAFGPASLDDAARWAGVAPARVRPAWNELSVDLVEVEPTRFVLGEDAQRLAKARPATSVVLLPGFDPYVLAPHGDRDERVDAAYAPRVYRAQGWISPVIVEAGRFAGTWSHDRRGTRVDVKLEPFEPLSEETQAAAEKEARALERYITAAGAA